LEAETNSPVDISGGIAAGLLFKIYTRIELQDRRIPNGLRIARADVAMSANRAAFKAASVGALVPQIQIGSKVRLSTLANSAITRIRNRLRVAFITAVAVSGLSLSNGGPHRDSADQY
jgi:hypothetical protein